MPAGTVSPCSYGLNMVIDCDSCTAGPVACADCVVSVLLGPIGGPVPVPEIVDDHREAVAVLVDSGLIPPLRLIPGGGLERPLAGGQGGHSRAAGA